MKYIFLAVFFSLSGVSCRYEDQGFFLSLEDPKGRITGDWNLESISKDGQEMEVIKCLPIEEKHDIEKYQRLYFFSNNTVKIKTEIIPYCQFIGKWELLEAKENIQLTFTHQRMDKHYDSAFVSPVIIDWRIVRLTKRYRENNGKTDIEGDLWVEEKRSDGVYEFHLKAY